MNFIWRSLVSAKLYRIGFVIFLITSVYLMMDKPGDLQLGFAINDKLAHACTFFILTLLISRGFPDHYGLLMLAYVAAFGLAIEGVQYFLPWRSFSLADWLADIAGILVYHGLHIVRVRLVTVRRRHKDV